MFVFFRLEAAEENLMKSVEYMKLCQPTNSNYMLLSMATLGTLYTILQKHEQAIHLLTYVVDTVGKCVCQCPCGTSYTNWISKCCIAPTIGLPNVGGMYYPGCDNTYKNAIYMNAQYICRGGYWALIF